MYQSVQGRNINQYSFGGLNSIEMPLMTLEINIITISNWHKGRKAKFSWTPVG